MTQSQLEGLIQRKGAAGAIAPAGRILLQRTPGPAGECEECRNKWLGIVQEVLRSPGQPLDVKTRAFMEPRFGHDFSQVRVHDDSLAAGSARAVNALAYTVGRDIVFGAGQYYPAAIQSQRLIAHELTHVVQQSTSLHSIPAGTALSMPGDAAERQADTVAGQLVSGIPVRFMPVASQSPLIQRQGKTPTNPNPIATNTTTTLANPMSRAEFERLLKRRYRVKDIHTGTFQEQKFGDMKQADWNSWDPGASSSIYTWIVEAFQNFESSFSGVPPVDTIVFFEAEYRQESPGHAKKYSSVLSSYSRAILTIYKGITTSNTLRTDTDVFKQPTDVESVHGNITHELGHGISEIALDQPGTGPAGQDPQLYVDYQKAVGWTPTSSGQLFDIQAPGVKDALDQGAQPPADAHIDKSNWYSAKWKERPLTSYMTDNPSDDFSEAIMAYVNQPATLQKLSPARYKFIDERKAKWGPAAKHRINIWEAAKKGGQPRTLLPAEKPTIWDRAKEAKD